MHSIYRKDTAFPFPDHFLFAKHSSSDMCVFLKVEHSEALRLMEIYTSRNPTLTTTFLNRDFGFMSHYVHDNVLRWGVYMFLYALVMTSQNYGVSVVFAVSVKTFISNEGSDASKYHDTTNHCWTTMMSFISS